MFALLDPPSLYIRVTWPFQAQRNVDPELPWFFDIAAQMPSFQIFCDYRSSQLKIPQGLSRVPVMNLTQKPSAELLWWDRVLWGCLWVDKQIRVMSRWQSTSTSPHLSARFGPMGPDSNWRSGLGVTTPAACPSEAANCHYYIPL